MIMRFVVGVLACMGVGGLALADPATPAPAPTSTAPSASTSAASAAAPAATAPASPAAVTPPVTAPASAAAAKTPEIDQVDKHFLSEGYKMEMRHGEKVFCRREDVLGSRLGAQKFCSTAQQLTATEREAKASVDKSMMQQNNPAGR
jgi:hypothetical protein